MTFCYMPIPGPYSKHHFKLMLTFKLVNSEMFTLKKDVSAERTFTTFVVVVFMTLHLFSFSEIKSNAR